MYHAVITKIEGQSYGTEGWGVESGKQYSNKPPCIINIYSINRKSKDWNEKN